MHTSISRQRMSEDGALGASGCEIKGFAGGRLNKASGCEWHGCATEDDPAWVTLAHRELRSVYMSASGSMSAEDAPEDSLGTVGALRSSIIASRSIGLGDNTEYTVDFANAGSGVTRVVAPVYTYGSVNIRGMFGWYVKIVYTIQNAQAPSITFQTFNHFHPSGMSVDRNFGYSFTSIGPYAVFEMWIPAAAPLTMGAASASSRWAPFPGVYGGVTADVPNSARVQLTGLPEGAGNVTVQWMSADSIHAPEVVKSALFNIVRA